MYTFVMNDSFLSCAFLLSDRSHTIARALHLALPVPLVSTTLSPLLPSSSRILESGFCHGLGFTFYAPHFFMHLWPWRPILLQTLISKHRFRSCAWICWTRSPGCCINVSCNLITICNASAWVEIFCCDNTVLKCGVKDATNHAWCCTSVNVILASCIVLFSLWSRSQGVSPRRIKIFLNLMIDCVSDFSQLNSLFNTF